MTPEKWRDLQSSIKLTIGNNNYRTWIDPLNFSHVEDDVAVFDVPTTFLGNYVEQNFGDVILHKLSEAQAQIRRIRFQVAARQTDIKKPLEARACPKVERSRLTRCFYMEVWA